VSTVKERARAKPVAVQVVLRMYCTKRLLGHPNPTDELYGFMMKRALDWWDALMVDAAGDGFTEAELALATIKRVRDNADSAWARILREGAN
jgi:hypothetical protein